MGGRFDSDVDPFTDEDFDEDAEEIMESSQVSKLKSSCITRMITYVCIKLCCYNVHTSYYSLFLYILVECKNYRNKP